MIGLLLYALCVCLSLSLPPPPSLFHCLSVSLSLPVSTVVICRCLERLEALAFKHSVLSNMMASQTFGGGGGGRGVACLKILLWSLDGPVTSVSVNGQRERERGEEKRKEKKKR